MAVRGRRPKVRFGRNTGLKREGRVTHSEHCWIFALGKEAWRNSVGADRTSDLNVTLAVFWVGMLPNRAAKHPSKLLIGVKKWRFQDVLWRWGSARLAPARLLRPLARKAFSTSWLVTSKIFAMRRKP